jgi:nucleoporin NUP82
MRSELASFIEQKVPARRRGSLKEEVKLSEATLNLLIKSHQILSQETHQLSLAAADLFRRCERLKDEFRDQIFRASQLATRIDGVTGDDEEDFDADEERIVGSAKIEKRLEEVKLKQHYLVTQHERIRKTLAKIGGRELTEREEAWVAELDMMDQSIDYSSQANNVNQENGGVPTWQRFDEVKRLKDDLMMQAREAGTDTEDEGANGAVKVPSEFRKQRVGRIMELLERETALVDAAAQRLNRLNVQAL